MFHHVQGSAAPLLLSWMVIGVGKEGKDFCPRPALRVVFLVVGDVRHSPTQIEEEQSYICIPEECLDLWGTLGSLGNWLFWSFVNRSVKPGCRAVGALGQQRFVFGSQTLVLTLCMCPYRRAL